MELDRQSRTFQTGGQLSCRQIEGESEKAPRVIDKLRGGDGRLGDGLKGDDKGKSDCITASGWPELSDTRCLMGFNCRIAIRGKIACY